MSEDDGSRAIVRLLARSGWYDRLEALTETGEVQLAGAAPTGEAAAAGGQ